MSLITMEELAAYMDDEWRLPDDIGGVYLGYKVGYCNGLLCNYCASEARQDGEDVEPEIVSMPMTCPSCGVTIGDERLEEYLQEHCDIESTTAWSFDYEDE